MYEKNNNNNPEQEESVNIEIRYHDRPKLAATGEGSRARGRGRIKSSSKRGNSEVGNRRGVAVGIPTCVAYCGNNNNGCVEGVDNDDDRDDHDDGVIIHTTTTTTTSKTALSKSNSTMNFSTRKSRRKRKLQEQQQQQQQQQPPTQTQIQIQTQCNNKNSIIIEEPVIATAAGNNAEEDEEKNRQQDANTNTNANAKYTNNDKSWATRKKKKKKGPIIIWKSMTKFLNTHIDYKWLKCVQLVCGIYILIVTFTYSSSSAGDDDTGTHTSAIHIFSGARDPHTGFIIDPMNEENTRNGIVEYVNPLFSDSDVVSRAIVASTTAQMILLGLSRFSGYFMYPAIVCVFWTKLRGTQAFIDKTPFRVFCIQDTHNLHVYCGYVILLDGCLHTICHLSRWILQGNAQQLLLGHQSGRTGLVVILSTFIIVFPMTRFMKKVCHIQFEFRKIAHYLFWIFCIAMTFHAPYHAIPNGGFCVFVFPLLMISYGVDALYVKCFMSELITTVDYQVLHSGVELTMPVSQRFQDNILSGGFGYIMFPWVDTHQWHAFSLYENAQDKRIRHMFIAKSGDWTSKVHRKVDICTNTSRPVWISGPFPSPYNNAINFDNMILVASGIGITPALSAIDANRDSRRINLIWTVRDASMLVFFLENAKLDEKGLNLIFFTGGAKETTTLPETIENYHQHYNNNNNNNNSNSNGAQHVKIIKGRPNLSYLIPNIIEFVDKGGINWKKVTTSQRQMQTTMPMNNNENDDNEELNWDDDPEESETEGTTTDNSSSALKRGGKDGVTTTTNDDSPDNNNNNKTFFEEMVNQNQRVLSTLDSPNNRFGTAANDYDCENEPANNSIIDDDNYDYGYFDLEAGSGGGRNGSQSFTNDDQQYGYYNYDDDEDDENYEWSRPLMPAITSNTTIPCSVLKKEPLNDMHEQEQQRTLFRTTSISDLSGGVKDTWRASSMPKVWEEKVDTRHYIKTSMAKDHLETWGLLFCGGRNKLLDNLINESKDLGIPLHQEAFDW